MNLLELARRYVAAGLSVIPVRADGTKQPDGRLLPREMDPDDGQAKPTWKPFQQRLATDEELQRWFSGSPVGIAVVCGAVSGGLEVMDFDTPEAFAAWSALVEETIPGLLAKLPQVRTPGGWHVYYRMADVAGNTKLARSEDGTALVETRGEGGYVLAPGCPAACHRELGLYIHAAGPSLETIPMLGGRS